ncbi:MAG: hypothetical protein QOF65_3023 [Thermoleophilaceae bacterium]|nr:hypothetical protein [Thermoleophilaceae bacterium]
MSTARTAAAPPTLRRLSTVQSAQVEIGPDGNPVRLDDRPVDQVRERWVVEEGWWTDAPVRRAYVELVLEDGGLAVAASADLLERRGLEHQEQEHDERGQRQEQGDDDRAPRATAGALFVPEHAGAGPDPCPCAEQDPGRRAREDQQRHDAARHGEAGATIEMAILLFHTGTVEVGTEARPAVRRRARDDR